VARSVPELFFEPSNIEHRAILPKAHHSSRLGKDRGWKLWRPNQYQLKSVTPIPIVARSLAQ
jgi:hypothetical protein